MKLVDRLRHVVSDALQRPLEAESFDDYLTLLKQYGVQSVTATPSRKNLSPYTAEEDTRIELEYNVRFSGIGRSGRGINYYHRCSRFEAPNPRSIYSAVQSGFKDIDETTYEDARDKTFLTARKLNDEITTQLPTIKTAIIGNDGEFTDKEYRELEIRAQERHLKPW